MSAWFRALFVALNTLKLHIFSRRNGVNEESLSHLLDSNRLIETEVSVLVGLFMQSNLPIDTVSVEELSDIHDRVTRLMEEIHHSVTPRFSIDEMQSDQNINGMIRESIFYGGESNYPHQFLDLAVLRYKNDNDWLIENKGFSVEDVESVASELMTMESTDAAGIKCLFKDPLSLVRVSLNQLSEKLSLDRHVVKNVLAAFSVQGGNNNHEFQSISDFNLANSNPLIEYREDEYWLFQISRLYQSVYESPYYWMIADNQYIDTASINNGIFAEDFCYKRLLGVFGKESVFNNVKVIKGKNIVGEIDVLVLFYDSAILVEAKSQKLTINARQGGNDDLIDNFNKAVSYAYEQIVDVVKILEEGSCSLRLENGNSVEIGCVQNYYPICLLSQAYPSLNWQVSLYFKPQLVEKLKFPVIMDIFCFDVLTEFLSYALFFFDYIENRQQLFEKLSSPNELASLAWYLKFGLNFNDAKYNMINIGDDHIVGASICNASSQN